MSRPTPPTYKTRNWPAYNEALKRRGSLTIWFDPAMTWDAAPTGKRGRQPDYSDTAIQTCLTMKVLFGMALRQTTGFVESLLRLIGLDWAVPDFSTLSRRQKTLKVNIVEFHPELTHLGSVFPLRFDPCDPFPLEIRAAEFTTSDIGDAPCCPNCSTRSRPIRRSAASPPTVPSIPASGSVAQIA